MDEALETHDSRRQADRAAPSHPPAPSPPRLPAADMFVMTGWAGYVGFDISGYKNIAAYIARCQALPFVAPAQAEMAAAK